MLSFYMWTRGVYNNFQLPVKVWTSQENHSLSGEIENPIEDTQPVLTKPPSIPEQKQNLGKQVIPGLWQLPAVPLEIPPWAITLS